MHVPARRRHRARARLDRHRIEALEVAADRPAGLGLPPMIYRWYPEHALGPIYSRWIAALAREEQGAEAREVVLLQQLAVGVFLLDGAERRRRGEQRDRLVFGDHPPEGAGVGRAD